MPDLIDIGASMTGKAVKERADKEYAEKEARYLEERKARRAQLLAAAAANPRPRGHFIMTLFRGARTIRTI